MFDVIGKRRFFFALSFLMTIPGLLFILLTPFTDGQAGLKFTIDYTGGTRWVIRFEDPNVQPAAVREEMAKLGLEATVVTAGQFLEIKTIPIGLSTPPPATPVPTIASPSASPGASGSPAASPSAAPSASPSPVQSATPTPTPGPSASPSAAPSASPAASVAPSPSASPAPPLGNTTLPTEGRLGEVAIALAARFGPIAEQQSLTTIGPVVSSDLVNQALLLILVGSAGIMAWITYRFRDVKFGSTALMALLHDVLVVVGLFAILGTFFNVEIDALFVTAMLTIIGFSVHDTIVVFDRIRENKARHAGEPFAEIVNHSILQTIGRSITTSFTVFITLLALFLFGGSATTYFVLALIIGISVGTYSSIFFAAPLLVEWQEWEDRRRGRTAASRSPRRATS
ncbi:MAG: protein translocase subunit SecF [Chloroflexota bacterium]|nr:protein translocase subunit SecF [Chloroflexota bacterium]